MSTMITLPDDVARKLQTEANRHKMPIEDLISDLLANCPGAGPEDGPSLDQVVANIKAMQPNPALYHPATESLAERLAGAADEPELDVESWNREWARIEAEAKAVSRANDLTEGRG